MKELNDMIQDLESGVKQNGDKLDQIIDNQGLLVIFNSQYVQILNPEPFQYVIHQKHQKSLQNIQSTMNSLQVRWHSKYCKSTNPVSSSLIWGLVPDDTSILIITGCYYNCTESIQVLGKQSCQILPLPPGFLDPIPILTADEEILACGNYAEVPEGSESMVLI